MPIGIVVIAILLIVAGLRLPEYGYPRIRSIQNAWASDSVRTETAWPVDIEGREEDVTVFMEFNLPMIHHTDFIVYADDCLRSMRVNGVLYPFQFESPERCEPGELKVDLAPYLQAGDNQIEALVHDKGGRAKFNMVPVPQGTLFVVSRGVIALTIVLAGLVLL